MSKFNYTVAALALAASVNVNATIVTLNTSAGDIDINLYDEITPATVDNFLSYVNAGLYDNTLVHRSEPGFVIQAGGYSYGTGYEAGFEQIETTTPVINEPKLSNVRGTIAMAKLANQADSATSQFFFNLANNANLLNTQSSGFTVFGELTEQSLAVVDSWSEFGIYDLSGLVNSMAFRSVPLRDFSVVNGDELPTEENFIIIYSAIVADPSVDTAAGLSPMANPYYIEGTNTASRPDAGNSGDSDSGGSLGWLSLLPLTLLARRRLQR